jgi:hypothetical protein
MTTIDLLDEIAATLAEARASAEDDATTIAHLTAALDECENPATILDYRERGGRGGLSDPLVKGPIPADVRMAVEVDPRRGGSGQGDYLDGVIASQDAASLTRLATEGRSLPPGSYCEFASEGDLPAHAPAGQTPAQRQAGFRAFVIAAASAFRSICPDVIRIASLTQGAFNSRHDAGSYFTPEVIAVLDGLAADGYSRATTGQAHSIAAIFGTPLAFAQGVNRDLWITEYGVEEHPGDNGAGKAAEYDSALPWLVANRATATKRGVRGVMFNTSTDGPAPDGSDWPFYTTPAAEAAFNRLVRGLLAAGIRVGIWPPGPDAATFTAHRKRLGI